MATIGDVSGDHRIIGVDTSIFIYHLKASALFGSAAALVLDAMVRGQFDGVTSVLTLMEVAVKPLQLGQPDVADGYEVPLSHFPGLIVVGLDHGVARRAAELRAAWRLRAPDALQLAACMSSGATAFLTNDKRLRQVTDVEVVLLEDFVSSEPAGEPSE